MNKWFKKAILILFVLMMSVLPVSAYVDIVEQDDSYFVTDEAKVLDNATEQYIISKNQILNETSGASIVVVTVDLLNADIVDYAYTIFNEWELGDETTNNGILLLLSIVDQDYYCMVGRGLENLLSSDELSDILYDDLEPDFAIGNYQQGVRKVFDTLYQRCVHLYNIDESASANQERPVSIFDAIVNIIEVFETILIVFIVITLMVVLFSILFRRRTVVHRPVPPPVYPGPVVPPRNVYRAPYVVHHRPSAPSMHRPVHRPSSTFSSRSSGFGSTRTSSAPRTSSSFRVRSGGSTRGAGAGRRR